MGGETSEQVIELLKELALLKALDKHYEASPNQAEAECEEHRVRQQRHDEITAAIKALAETKQSEA